MATYLQGVTDTGFNSVNTTPNLPYMMNALQKVTARYEKNYNELSNEYSKITDSLLLNPENNEFRTKFLDNSKTALKTLSTQDLSIQSNVDQAEQIFSPFWEDKDLMADYITSKDYQKQVQNYNRLKDSDKKEDRDQAWDMGLSYVQLTANEMSLAKRGDGSIASVKVRPYVPYKNLNKEIFEELKNLGYENGVITKAYAGNGYIKTITNGAGTKALYTDVLQKILTNRMDLKEIFKVQGVTYFESTVFDEMKKNPSLSREEIERNVKQEFATKQITSYDKQLNNINEQLNETKDYKGLIRDIAETETSIYNRLDTGALSMDSTEAKSFFEKLNKKDELIRVKSLYEEKINNLKSDDFKKSKGEDYLTSMFMDQFIDDNSSSREAAISEKITSDSGYASAMNLNEKINEFNRTTQQKEEKAQEKQNGVGGTLTIGDDGQITITPNSENKKIKSKEKTQSELLNVPFVTSDYFSNAKDLEKSFLYNFVENKYNYSKLATDAAATYLNTSKSLSGINIPHITEYIDYLNHYTHGGKPVSKFKESEMKEAHKALLDKKIITAGKYSENAPLQLNQLIQHVDEIEDKNNTPYESVVARSNYDLFSKYYLEAGKIEKEFNIQNSNKPINERFSVSLRKHVEKDKNNQYQFITAEKLAKDFPNLNKENQKFNIPIKFMQQYIDGTLSIDDEPVYKYNTNSGENRTGRYLDHTNYYIKDPTTGKRLYTITNMVNTYGLPKAVAAKKKEYEEDKGIKFSEYVATNGKLGGSDLWIMSKTLTYNNNPADLVQDKSAELALKTIVENKTNLIEGSGGIIKPLNFNKLTDYNGAAKEEMTEILGMLFNNQDALNASLSSTNLRYQGSNNESSFIKLNFNLQNLQKNLMLEEKGAKTARLKKAITVLAGNGLEFNVSKNTFREFAKDDYMQSSVREGLLRGNGLTATDYEKNNFHYDYKLTLGSNDKMILTYTIKSYNPQTKKYKEKEERLEYSKEVGIDNILKDVREVGVANGIEINKFLTNEAEQELERKELEEAQKKESNAPNSRQADESLEVWKKRIELQGKKMYKG